MQEHTPGPWRSVRFLVLAGKRHVADASDITATAHGGTEDEGFANANLIAAAPELLETLRALLLVRKEGMTQKTARKISPEVDSAYMCFGSTSAMKRLIQKAESVIAKAEGK